MTYTSDFGGQLIDNVGFPTVSHSYIFPSSVLPHCITVEKLNPVSKQEKKLPSVIEELNHGLK
jgi:hypothetical protein